MFLMIILLPRVYKLTKRSINIKELKINMKDKITIPLFVILVVGLVLTGFIFTKIQNLQSITKKVQTQVASLQEAVKSLLAQAIPATPAQPSPGTGTPAIPAIPATPPAKGSYASYMCVTGGSGVSESESYIAYTAIGGVGPCTIFTRNLQRGSSGDDVKWLQQFLKELKKPEIYPEGLVTGYYGPQTESAIRRLEKQCNMTSSGVVAPKLVVVLNELVVYGSIEICGTLKVQAAGKSPLKTIIPE